VFATGLEVVNTSDDEHYYSDLEWNRALLTTALISDADVSMSAFEPQEDIPDIHRDIN